MYERERQRARERGTSARAMRARVTEGGKEGIERAVAREMEAGREAFSRSTTCSQHSSGRAPSNPQILIAPHTICASPPLRLSASPPTLFPTASSPLGRALLLAPHRQLARSLGRPAGRSATHPLLPLRPLLSYFPLLFLHPSFLSAFPSPLPLPPSLSFYPHSLSLYVH